MKNKVRKQKALTKEICFKFIEDLKKMIDYTPSRINHAGSILEYEADKLRDLIYFFKNKLEAIAGEDFIKKQKGKK